MRRNNFFYKLFFVLLTISLIGFVGCEKYEPPIDDDDDDIVAVEPKIKSFILEKSNNPQLKEDVHGEIATNNQIDIIIDYPLSDITFKPTIEYSDGLTISPDPNQEISGATTTKYSVSNGIEEEEYEVVFYINNPLELLYFKVNGTLTYYNKSSRVYHVPVDQSKWGEPYIFEVTGLGIEKVFVNDVEITQGEATSLDLNYGQTYEVKVSKGGDHIRRDFILSGLPIVSIRADYDVYSVAPRGSERGPSYISVYDPTEGGEHVIEDKYAGIRRRGGHSNSKQKHSYSLEFQDKESLEEVDISLFGLRSDGDWIFDAVATDISRLRNRVCTDLWNELHTLAYIASEPKARHGTRGRMTEVYFNDEYRGIYCITERIDRKQLDLDKLNGYLYKAENWDDHIMFKDYNSARLPRDGNERWGGYQAEYPKAPNTRWSPVVDLVKFVCDSDDKKFSDGISARFDIDNLVDYFIFVNIAGAIDNISKNTFMCMYNGQGSNLVDRKLFYTAWDLDGTMGRSWNMTKMTPGYIIGLSNDWSGGEYDNINHLMKRMAVTDSDGFGAKVKKRWAEVKGGVCSKESIVSRFRSYQIELEGSGAYQRESTMWSDARDLTAEINYIEGWLEVHLDYLDRYIQNWDSNISEL